MIWKGGEIGRGGQELGRGRGKELGKSRGRGDQNALDTRLKLPKNYIFKRERNHPLLKL